MEENINPFSSSLRDINLFRNIYDKIFDHLSYIDRLAILYANPRIYPHIDRVLLDPEKIIREEFERNDIDYHIFKSRFLQSSPDLITEKGKSILFGGILLGIITSNINPNSDFDLLHFECRENIFYPIKTISFRNPYHSYLSTYHHPSNRNIETTLFHFLNYPAYLIGTEAFKWKYQHNTLLYKTNSILEYIDEYCDYEFTKIIYDGKKIKIKNINSIFEKTIKINYSKILKNDIKFNYMNNENEYYLIFIQRCVYYFLSRIESRTKKYMKRGFIIDFGDCPFKVGDVIDDVICRYNIIFTKKFKSNHLPFKQKYLEENESDMSYMILLKKSLVIIPEPEFKRLYKNLDKIIDKYDLSLNQNNKKMKKFVKNSNYYFIHYLIKMYHIEGTNSVNNAQFKVFLDSNQIKIFEPYEERYKKFEDEIKDMLWE